MLTTFVNLQKKVFFKAEIHESYVVLPPRTGGRQKLRLGMLKENQRYSQKKQKWLPEIRRL